MDSSDRAGADDSIFEIAATITPASPALLDPAALADVPAPLAALATRLSAATHSSNPELAAKLVLIFAGDHGIARESLPIAASPDEDLSAAAVRAITRGEAAVCAAARAAGAAVMIVDCGLFVSDSDPSVIELGTSIGLGAGTADMRRGPAMAVEEAVAALRVGLALGLSVAGSEADVIALGHLGQGCHLASTALICALTDSPVPSSTDGRDQAAITAALARVSGERDPIALLAAVGGYEIAAMTGIILAAAAVQTPVVLDDHGTAAAALLASRIAPHSVGYLVASHAGTQPCHAVALEALGLTPLFTVGIAHGEGTGACMALHAIDNAAELLSRL